MNWKLWFQIPVQIDLMIFEMFLIICCSILGHKHPCTSDKEIPTVLFCYYKMLHDPLHSVSSQEAT